MNIYQAYASVAFTALSLPGSDIIAVVIRALSMSLTLLFMIVIQPIMFARILRYKMKKEDIVANNPSIAILQAGVYFVLSVLIAVLCCYTYNLQTSPYERSICNLFVGIKFK
jgi:uncharacterized protein YacL